MQGDLNIDQLVMVRDRHRLNRLGKAKDADRQQYQELFEKSNAQVKARFQRLPQIKLNHGINARFCNPNHF